MSHIRYTICRSGTFYYNRRVPSHAVAAYGTHIRQALSSCPIEAEAYATRLSNVLEASWASHKTTTPINIPAVVDSFKPKSYLLSEMADEYLSLRKIDAAPPKLALETFISLAGDRDVVSYTRDDAKLFVDVLLSQSNKTATIRRRINCISAILNYAYAELDVDKRNPFSRLFIKGEGQDAHKRGTFNLDQLKQGYEHALSSGSQVKLLMPILGETGCRLAEIVGLELDDIDMTEEVIHIRPNSIRRLKTSNSIRTLPLVGCAKEAMLLALQHGDEHCLYPRYLKDGTCRATHASNALGKWLKKDFGMTAHSLRHTFRDRLRASGCPLELIDQIGGWSSVGTIGSKYGQGYELDAMRERLFEIRIT
jgi:integrase